MSEQLKKKARGLLENKGADVIIGYAKGSNGHKTTPVFVTRPDDVDRLVWNQYCLNNLSVYLVRDEVKKLGKPAIVAKGCDVKSIIGLIQENQIKRDDIFIIGMECKQQVGLNGSGQKRDHEEIILEKCLGCDVHIPQIHDVLINDSESSIENPSSHTEKNLQELVEEMDQKPIEDRWAYWQSVLKRCIKCYACRQACPLCYCKRCIVEKTRPQWIYPGIEEKGNLTWNVIRSFHLAGRCIGCGECERVCPMNIPLGLVNKKMALEVKEEFDYEAGVESPKKPAMSDFKYEDDDSFIR